MTDSTNLLFPVWKKGLCAFLLFFYIITSSLIGLYTLGYILNLYDLPNNRISMPKKVDLNSMLCTALLLEMMTTTICIGYACKYICLKQVAECERSIHFKLSTGMHSIICAIVLLPRLLCDSCTILTLRVLQNFLIFTIANYVCTLAVYVIHRLLCTCKTCNMIKDVNLIYLDEVESVHENSIITSQFLLERFRISLANDEKLAIQGVNYHTFYNGDETFSFVPGNWLVTVRKLTEEVNISYLNKTKKISERKIFNEKHLREWFNIDVNGMLVVESMNGDIVHTFHNKNNAILKEGNYVVKIFGPTLEIQPTQTAYTALLEPESVMLTVD